MSRPERYQFPVFFQDGFSYSGSPFSWIYDFRAEYTLSVAAIDTKAFQEASLLVKTENSTFDPTDPTKYVRTTTEYAYKEQNLAVSEQSTRASTGEVFKTTYKYPHDFISEPLYLWMVNTKHIWSPVVESSTYKTSTTTAPLESTRMRYDVWNGSIDQVYPAEVSTKSQNSSVYESRIQYLAYDEKGNVLSVSKAGDVPTSYLWGYSGQRPIAEVRNATPSAVAYTSFEEASPGGWTFNNSYVTSMHTFTGRRGYELDPVSAAEISRTDLAAGDYELHLWAYGADVPLVGGASTQQHAELAAAGAWHHHRYTVTLPANATLTISAPSTSLFIMLDEVRLHPVGAAMTTFTHDPLVGVTSRADATGQPTFYEYDGFQRLFQVKDWLGNILTQQEYHYQP